MQERDDQHEIRDDLDDVETHTGEGEFVLPGLLIVVGLDPFAHNPHDQTADAGDEGTNEDDDDEIDPGSEEPGPQGREEIAQSQHAD